MTPLYRQLAEQIAAAIESGEFGMGMRIPSRRELTEDYGVDLGPNQVQQGIDLLKSWGLVQSSPGLGVFVVSDKRKDPRPEPGGSVLWVRD